MALPRDGVDKIRGGEAVFSIKAFATRVAAVRFGEGPLLLLADHLEGERPILIFRVDDFQEAVKSLKARGINGEQLEIPHGPCFSFKSEGGQTSCDLRAHEAGNEHPLRRPVRSLGSTDEYEDDDAE